MQSLSIPLVENASATGPWVFYPGGPTVLIAQGNWGAGNVTLEMLGPDGLTPLTNMTGAAISANGLTRSFNILMYPAGQYRANISGGATNVYLRMDRVPI